MRTVSYFVILSYSFPSQIKTSNNTNGMSVLLYDILNIMQNYVITLQLGQGEHFSVVCISFSSEFPSGVGGCTFKRMFYGGAACWSSHCFPFEFTLITKMTK